MSLQDSLKTIIGRAVDEETLWDGAYKIPWDDPDFSRRMLAEHLSQEHDLASRKQDMIRKQAQWIHEYICNSTPAKLLDIGCGPGLYIEQFAAMNYNCCGIDFSPASIEYAMNRLGDKAKLIKGDIRSVDFGGGYDLAMMVFGEFNVFSPDECRRILKKTLEALSPGGKLLLEAHTFEAVERIGSAPNSWYKSSPGLLGLFSDEAHICLIENHWLDKQQTALQQFHVLDAVDGTVKSYRSTTKAWTNDQYKQLLTEAGFTNITIHPGWPIHSQDLLLLEAGKV
ncbi:MAG: class I SAM-dependent methyltransferase [Planctomycetota bacterium]|jgi:SAM-dependent methyltransferase